MNIKYIAIILISVALLSSCKPELSDSELRIIEHNLALKVYAENVEEAVDAQELYNQLWDGVAAYVEEVERKYEKDSYDPFGFMGLANAFGIDPIQEMQRKYDKYVNFCNNHREQLANTINEVIEVVATKRDLKMDFVSNEESSEYMSLASFAGIKDMPESTFYRNFVNYFNDIDDSNQAIFGRCLMGTVDEPKFSPDVIVAQVIKRSKEVPMPKAVYAIYYEEDDAWLVGYDSKDALEVVFEKDGSRVHYTWIPVRYNYSYISDKDNVLNKKKKK